MRQIILNKSALAASTIVGTMLLLLFFIVAIVFIGEASLVGKDLSVGEQCRLSVERNARFHFAGIDLGADIDCPTLTEEITEDDTPDEAKKKIADTMYQCWKRFGQGKLNLFGQTEGVFCNICYVIDVNTNEPLTGFGEYLSTTPSPTENMYYSEYLSGFKSEGVADSGFIADLQKYFNKDLQIVEDIELERLKGVDINNNEQYAAIFVYAKGNNDIEKIIRQLTLKSDAGKVITPMATGTAVLTGAAIIGVAIGTGGVGVPVIIVAAAGAAIAFSVTEYVGSIFNPDSPPDWAAFTVLRVWNSEVTPGLLINELGCREFVETENN